MPTPVRFWVDPICPWCWTTSQWIRRIAADKDLEITWEPISLLVKNETKSDSPYYEPVAWTRGLLRVMESVRAAGHDARLGDLYTEYGRRIHHDGERLFDPAVAPSRSAWTRRTLRPPPTRCGTCRFCNG